MNSYPAACGGVVDQQILSEKGGTLYRGIDCTLSPKYSITAIVSLSETVLKDTA